ncbi:hypothetical protein T492DRAFT_835832 [Pavlovales sp. CCMP2436]|nr:hypothetical protein T492DRAFT_835832 [Pavlovales sp. CCMP2436]
MRCAAELVGLTVLNAGMGEGGHYALELRATPGADVLIEAQMQATRSNGAIYWDGAGNAKRSSLHAVRLHVRVTRRDASDSLADPGALQGTSAGKVPGEAQSTLDFDVLLADLVPLVGNWGALRSAEAEADDTEPLLLLHNAQGAWVGREAAATLLAATAIWPVSWRCAQRTSNGINGSTHAAVRPPAPVGDGGDEGGDAGVPGRATLSQIADQLRSLRGLEAERGRLGLELVGLLHTRTGLEDARSSLEQSRARLLALANAVRASGAWL